MKKLRIAAISLLIGVFLFGVSGMTLSAQAAEEVIFGDLNGDGVWNAVDLVRAKKATGFEAALDFDGDGDSDADDIAMLRGSVIHKVHHRTQLTFSDKFGPTKEKVGMQAHYACLDAEACGTLFADANGETVVSADDLSIAFVASNGAFKANGFDSNVTYKKNDAVSSDNATMVLSSAKNEEELGQIVLTAASNTIDGKKYLLTAMEMKHSRNI